MPIDRQYIVNRQGKDHVLYEGLLHEAHKRGLTSIETYLEQNPSDSNGQTAICRARVEMKDGGRFSGIGDANPTNVNRMILPHIIRMAETRAKARALRDALDIGAAAIEELGGDEEPEPAKPASTFVDVSKLAPTGGRTVPVTDQIRLMIRDLVRMSGRPYEECEKALIARAGVRMGTNLSNAALDELAPDALDMVREETRKALDKAKQTTAGRN